jgi:hypothetical protein
MSASDKIARLRELRDEYWKAAGPFKMPPNVPAAGLNVFQVERYFAETASVALPALLECAEALDKVLINLSAHIEYKGAVDVNVAIAFEAARAALDALSKDTP